MHADLKNGFRLGHWLVRPLISEIEGPDGAVHLEPRVMEVLLALAERHGEVVERDALLANVWGARGAVSDEPLTRCIAELRRALKCSAQTPVFIQTIPKRGYRLISEAVPLTPEPRTPAGAPPSTPLEDASTERASADVQGMLAPAVRARPRRHTTVMLASLGVIGILGAALVLDSPWRAVPSNSANDDEIARNTIAVLPFVNVGGTSDGEHFSEGLADEILNRLSYVEGLRVVARTSSFAFAGSTADVRTIAERLRVAHLLEGSVRRSGDDIRITVQLVDAERGYQVWSENYQGRLGDIFPMQDEIANAIIARLHDSVPALPEPGLIATRPPTEDVAAYELLLRGRQQANRRDELSLRRSIELFLEAIERDTGFGQAYFELAKAYALLPAYSSELPDEMYDLALATVGEGIRRDTSIQQAMQGLVALIAYSRWDWIAAEIAFRSALEQSRNDPDVLVWYSQFLSSVGRPLDSLDQARRAKEIDLLSPVVNHRLSVALMWADEDADALRYSQVAAELGMGSAANPDSFIVLRLRSGDYSAVRPMLIGVQTMFAQQTAWVDLLLEALESPASRASAVDAVANAQQSRDIARKYLFGAWLYLGESDRALETALQLVHDRPSFSVEFLFSREAEALRRHPRFGELVRAIGLNRYWDQFGWPEMCRQNGQAIACR